MQSGKLIDFLKVRKCGMLCVNFRSVAEYNSAVIEFWPLPLEQRINIFLKHYLVVRRIHVKITLKVVKASKVVEMKLTQYRKNLLGGHFENILLLFVGQYGCLRQKAFH